MLRNDLLVGGNALIGSLSINCIALVSDEDEGLKPFLHLFVF